VNLSQKNLIKKLLKGCFLRKDFRYKKEFYILFDEKRNPLCKVRPVTVTSLDRFIDPKIKIWKKNKRSDISLNLSMVRRLHGRNTIKAFYKKRDQLETSNNIYKQRPRKIRKSSASPESELF
jgi:hypothetical protein